MKTDIKLVLLVGLLIVSLAWGTGSVLSVAGEYVHNLDTGEYFLTMGHALLDPDTLPGHTIKLEDGYNTIPETLMVPFQIQKDVIIEGIPGIQEFSRFELMYSDYLTFKYIDSGNVLLFTPQPPQPTTFWYVHGIWLDNLHNNLFQNIVTSNVSLNIQTEAPNTIAHAISHGIELQDSKYNTFQYLEVADISSTANASASSSTASATAVSRADGIYLDDSADNTFQYIDIEEINSAANASASSVFSYATADSYAYGLELDESNGNTFQDIDIKNVTSQANAEAVSASKADAEADSRAYGIHLSESNYNTFQYIGIAGISSTARAGASSPGSADAEADSRAYGIHLDDSNYNIFRYIDIENISSDATASAVDSSGIPLATAESAAYGINLDESNDNIFQYSSITDTGVGILNGSSSTGTKINYSSLSGNTIYGVQNNNPNYELDATLNWWGDDSGPAHLTNTGGAGDSVSNNVIYSPWLADSLTDGTGIDTDPDTPGIQLPENVNIIVDDVGPAPEDGFLITALEGAASLPDPDTIHVMTKEGSYNDVTNRVIEDHITIPTGQDGSGLTMNYNNITGILTHNGTGTVDALFNNWGTDGPSVAGNTGNILYSPWLNDTPGSSPMTYMVDDVGANPQGSLTRAIGHANSDSVIDEIFVLHGTYDSPQPITEGLNLLSETGSASNTYINGNLDINSAGVTVGGPNQGFTVTGDVTIGSAVTGTFTVGTLRINILVATLRRNILNGSLTHNGTGTVDALFNNWGADGPSVAGNTGNILYSPWLNDTPGSSPMTYMVDYLGYDPQGSLDRAIGDANNDPDTDTIIVNHGTYEAVQPITESVEIVSVLGSPANTFISEGTLNINSSNVTIGKRVNNYISRGFTINGNITVGGGVDASSVHINWNNILGTVTNNGAGSLDATYNWWGSTNPDDSTVGSVNYTPHLPAKVGTMLTYMETNGITSPRAAIAGMVCGAGSSSEQAVCKLSGMGLNPDQANGLLSQFGLSRVTNAINNGKTTSKFTELLGGYSLPAGGAAGLTNNLIAGGGGSIGGRRVGAVFGKGETVEVGFALSDFAGNPSVDINPTVSLVLLDGGGKLDNLVDVTTAVYDDSSSSYVSTFESLNLAPGYYLVQVDLPDISSLSQVIQVEGVEA